MTWVTWRQSRTELLIFGIALAAVATLLIWTGLDLRSDIDGLKSAGCLVAGEESESCSQLVFAFVDHFGSITNLTTWLNFLPMLLGILVAAPLVLDLEQGTYRLAWTQGVPRSRWLAVKLALALAILIVASLMLYAVWVWWGRPMLTTDRLDMFTRFDSTFFNNSGPVLISYAIFTFALCLAVGAMVRRSIAAFGITLVGYIAVRLLIENKFRLNFLSPLKSITDSATPGSAHVGRGAWIIDSGPSDQYGNLLPWNNPAVRECFGGVKSENAPAPSPEQISAAAIEAQTQCLHDHGIYMTTLYHPTSRFWIFQGIESAIFLGLSALLLGITFYWVTRRIAR